MNKGHREFIYDNVTNDVERPMLEVCIGGQLFLAHIGTLASVFIIELMLYIYKGNVIGKGRVHCYDRSVYQCQNQLTEDERRKKKVYAWTVDDDMDFMQEMLSEHVDAIVTSKATPWSNARYQNTVSAVSHYQKEKVCATILPSHLTLF
ncbi:unnamed protein product, partial [Prunus brigantina]